MLMTRPTKFCFKAVIERNDLGNLAAFGLGNESDVKDEWGRIVENFARMIPTRFKGVLDLT
jgi:hypothetical protein